VNREQRHLRLVSSNGEPTPLELTYHDLHTFPEDFRAAVLALKPGETIVQKTDAGTQRFEVVSVEGPGRFRVREAREVQ
jgi:hypothetical protein